MFFMIQSNLLNFFIGALEATDTLIINPDLNTRFIALLHCDDPIFMWIQCYNVVSMSLHEKLLSGLDVFSHQNTSSTVVDEILLEQHIRVEERWEGENCGELD